MTSYLIPALLSVLVAAPAAAIVQPVILVGSATTFELRVIIVGSSTAAAGGIQEVTPAAGAFTVTISGQPAAAALADGAANPVTLSWAALLEYYNGASWDRARGDTANGLDVDVTRVQGTVATGPLLDTNRDGVPDALWGATMTGQGRVAGLVIPSSGGTLLEASVSVATTPTALAAANLASGSHLILLNNQTGPARTIFVGGPGVTALTGLPVASGASLDLSPYTGAANQVFALSVGGTAEVRVLRW
jgi:hypothetical protein